MPDYDFITTNSVDGSPRSRINSSALPVCVILLMLISCSCLAEEQPASSFQWPDGIKAAVNLAYDDALDSQLDHAIPALDRLGMKGSFYLTLASQAFRLRSDEWRAAAENGHELGNHSLFHPCSSSPAGRDWVEPWNDLDSMSVEEVRQHLLLTNTVLNLIDGQTERTYTATCGDALAGGESYLPAVASEFVAIKARIDGVTPSMDTVDPFSVSVVAPVGLSGEELIALVEEAGALGTMVNFTFHGIGGDHLQTSIEAHEELLQYLAENRDKYWVDTFLQIMTYVKTQQATE